MAKADLQKVLAMITDKKSIYYNSNTYRDNLNPETHELQVTEKDVLSQLIISFSIDPNFNLLKSGDIELIASEYYKGLISFLSSPIRGAIPGETTSALTSIPGVFRSKYSTFSKALQAQNKLAIETYKKLINKETSLASGQIMQFDHRKTVSDTRYADLLTRGSFNLIQLLGEGVGVREEEIQELFSIHSYYTSNNSKVFRFEVVVQGDLESGYTNEERGKKEVLDRSQRITAGLKKLELKGPAFWAQYPGSDSKIQLIEKIIVGEAMKKLNKNIKFTSSIKNITPNKQANTVKKEVKNVTKTKVTKLRVAGASGSKQKAAKAASSYVSLIPIFNAKLPPVVRLNMVGSRLHNVTGTFSESVKVVDIRETEKGFPSIAYTYQRDPYDVFDPVIGTKPWNTPGRDPKELIDVSIRQIAQQLAFGRFYTRRA